MTREEAKELLEEIKVVDDTIFHYNDAYMISLEIAIKALEQEPALDKIKTEIEKQEKWLLQAGYTTYNVDIAFDAIKAVIAESEGEK